MRLHSRVGLVSNSSSTIYTWYNKDPQQRLREVGEEILKALGDTRSFDEVFSIDRRISGDFVDRFRDDTSDFAYFEDDDRQSEFEGDLESISTTMRSEFEQPWYQLGTEERARYDKRHTELFLELINKYDIDVPETSENYDGYTRSNFDYILVAKATGLDVDIARMFNKVFDQEAGYN